MSGAGFQVFRVGALRVAFERSAGPLAGIVLSARTGSRFDGARPGIAHLAEHMLFQGTRSLDHAAINQRAAELGGDHDASTSYEDLNLTFQVLNADVAGAIALLAEQVLRSVVPRDRLENERQVVCQEIRGHREDAIGHLSDETWARFFADGLRLPPSGTLASVRSTSAAEVRDFLRRRLVGANLVLSIVGDLQSGDVRRAVAREFRALAPGVACIAPPVRIARRGEVRLRRSGLTQLYLTTLFSVPAGRRELLALGLALEILGTDPDGRLYHEIRERRGLSYDLWADLPGGAQWAALAVGAVAERRAERRLREAIDGVFTRAASEGFSAEEIDRARRKLRYRYARLSEAKLERAASHAAALLYGTPSLEEAEAIVASLRREEIERAWRVALGGPRLTGVLTGD
ncbi:MAG: insulinase family protein [Deltaproteobacteria bacterium]|nr:insulinase family protein [Deltaproteobacteria bacterium]